MQVLDNCIALQTNFSVHEKEFLVWVAIYSAFTWVMGLGIRVMGLFANYNAAASSEIFLLFGRFSLNNKMKMSSTCSSLNSIEQGPEI